MITIYGLIQPSASRNRFKQPCSGPTPNAWPDWLDALFSIFFRCYFFALLFDDKTHFHYEKNTNPNFCQTRWNTSWFLFYKTAPLALIISQVGFRIAFLRAVPEFCIFFCSYLSTILSDDKKDHIYVLEKKTHFCQTRWNAPRFLLYKTAPVVLIISPVVCPTTFPTWNLTGRAAS